MRVRSRLQAAAAPSSPAHPLAAYTGSGNDAASRYSSRSVTSPLDYHSQLLLTITRSVTIRGWLAPFSLGCGM